MATSRNIVPILAIIAGVAVVLFGIVTYEVAVWRECITTHPWWFCLRVLG